LDTPGETSALRAWLRAETPDQPFVAGPRARIFLLSFGLLFFELLCIRWIPSYVKYLAYFTNFILLASFLGLGLGVLAARRARFWFVPFPVMLLVLSAVVLWNKFDFRISSTQVLYYGAGESGGAKLANYLVVPFIFALVAAAFIPLARQLGELIGKVEPLSAYTYDILGSLAGTASFFLIAQFSLPPVVWFGILAVLVLLAGDRRLLPTVLSAAFLLGSIGIAAHLQKGAFWSPYYKILLHPAKPSGYIVDVNNAGGHQLMAHWEEKEPFYRRVYELFPGSTFRNAAILGAGSGSDVATALAKGVPSVTAVEIDPRIQQLGSELHPDRPYQDPRVKVVIDDGRAFLRNTTERFDLIVFALPDSLTLTSGMTSLRLESFLLTRDSIAAAREKLSDDGVLVLYNYYREDWLVARLATMMGQVFGQQPLVSTYGGWGRAAILMAGPRLAQLPPGAFGPYTETPSTGHELRVIGEGFYPPADLEPATDDWPFLYLRQRSFPGVYAAGLAVIGLMSVVAVAAVAPRATLRRFDLHMFFLGVAFALLEVKSLTTFALLFGNTWKVNSMVFFAILSGVLLAILVNRRFRIQRVGLWYALLFGVLALNLALPPEKMLLGSGALRYVIASLLCFAPVFAANVIFSHSFKDSEQADVAFASNLLGIMAGGMLEYFSMLTGYRLLLLAVMAFYALALVGRRERDVAPAAVLEPAAG
jgi:hypothetical protein